MPDSLEDTINRILTHLYISYRKAGLHGIAPYQRSKRKSVEVAGALINAIKKDTIMNEFFPEHQDIALNFPTNQPTGVVDQFYAIEQEVEGRRHLRLVHWYTTVGNDYLLMTQRHFYSIHSYNVLEIIIACLPNSTVSVVAGFFSKFFLLQTSSPLKSVSRTFV